MSATTTGATSLFGALLAFQAEAPTLSKDATNPHFKSRYTPLDTIVETVQPLLAKHGLVWSTFPCETPSESPALRYVLAHAESGETLEGTMPLLAAKRDPQGQGSAITYARRYAICAVLNLVADEDDDGNGGSSRAAAEPQGTVAKDADRPAAPPIPVDRATLILTAAEKAGLATVTRDEDGNVTGVSFSVPLKAFLATLNVRRFAELNSDTAEAVEAFIRSEAESK